MKKLLLIILLCFGCEQRISQDLEADTHGHVTINGKSCEIFTIEVNSYGPRILFVDCGPGSSGVAYQAGKVSQSVGQYIPPPLDSFSDAGMKAPGVCHCPDMRTENQKN